MPKARVRAGTSKPAEKPKTQELPGVTGPGVEPLKIEAVDKAISNYEKKKSARCAESPGELEAKKNLLAILHQHRDKLPLMDGVPFYRSTDYERDYILEEKIKVQKIETAEEAD
jgi:hypothetical protein